VQFLVLGSLEVVHDDCVLDLGRAQQRALLALLLVHANQVVAADRIAAVLWPGNLPDDPSAAVHVQVSLLHQMLARCGRNAQAVLEEREPGYVLHIGDDDLDAARFERLVEAGRIALAVGWMGEAAVHLGSALGLWRGDALADFAGQAFVHDEATRLRELRLAVVEDWIEAELVLGHHATVVGELRRLADSYPLREPLWAQLMLALYRSDRQAEALRAFGRLRANLAGALGIDPSPALQQLGELVRLQKPDLEWRPPTTGAAEDDYGGR
jgi:DNA-binding SARP family transcriptional activator